MIPRQFIWLTLLVFLMSTGADHAKSQTNSVEISQSVHGQFAFYNHTGQIYLVDTFTGQSSEIINYSTGGRTSNVIWSPQGTQLAYLAPGDIDNTIFDLSTLITSEIGTFPGREGIFYPVSWVNDVLLYINPVLGVPGTGTYTLNLMDTTTGMLIEILSYDEGMILSNFPLPQGINQFKFSSIKNAEQNPVYPDWMVLQISGTDPTQLVTNDFGTQELLAGINVLWNYTSGEIISLDTFFNGTVDQSSRLFWHPDGEHLLVPVINEANNYKEVIQLNNETGIPVLQRMAGSESINVTVYDWLGAGELLLVKDRTPNNEYDVYQIAEIINGTWYISEFFRISKTDYPIALWGDWHLTATQEEKYELSCLFDQALSARIAFGQRARVNFTDGTPLRLRTEPDFASTEIMQMPEGTEFDIIGGSACVNSTDYYRFWHLELDDGTIGWASEASTSDYFIEPVSANSCDSADSLDSNCSEE